MGGKRGREGREGGREGEGLEKGKKDRWVRKERLTLNFYVVPYNLLSH